MPILLLLTIMFNALLYACSGCCKINQNVNLKIRCIDKKKNYYKLLKTLGFHLNINLMFRAKQNKIWKSLGRIGFSPYIILNYYHIFLWQGVCIIDTTINTMDVCQKCTIASVYTAIIWQCFAQTRFDKRQIFAILSVTIII